MSDKAFNAFNQNQIDVLSKYAKLIKVNVEKKSNLIKYEKRIKKNAVAIFVKSSELTISL